MKNKFKCQPSTVCIILVITVLLMTGCSSALTGKVVFSSDNSPIEGAVVSIEGQSQITDVQGNFQFEKIKNGDVKGIIEVSDFPDTDFSIELKEDKNAVFEVESAKLNIDIVENAVEEKPIKNETVLFDGKETDYAQLEKPIPIGKHSIEVQSKKHEPYSEDVDLIEGDNDIQISLNLTPLETYKRYSDASIFLRYDDQYKYMHPDEKKIISLKKYKKYIKKWDEDTRPISVKHKEPRMLEEWQVKWLKKTYTNVAEIDRTLKSEVVSKKYSNYGEILTNNKNQHWIQESDGRWYKVNEENYFTD